MILSDEGAMDTLGRALGAQLRAGDIVALTGPLGVGKTTLARGMLSAAGHEGEVSSPTFAIVHHYDSPPLRLPVAHADLYRLESDEELDELGLDDVLFDGALIVEWPQRLPPVYARAALRLTLDFAEGGARRLTADAPPAWESRWPPA